MGEGASDLVEADACAAASHSGCVRLAYARWGLAVPTTEMSDRPPFKARDHRKTCDLEMEFIIDADVLRAQAVNISDSGVRLDTSKPLEMILRYQQDGSSHERRARLVWAREVQAGFDYGLEFIGEELPLPDEL